MPPYKPLTVEEIALLRKLIPIVAAGPFAVSPALRGV
jgi:hypothetical protein